jgi:hypothetical protein
MNYSILNGKMENKIKLIWLLFEFKIIITYSFYLEFKNKGVWNQQSITFFSKAHWEGKKKLSVSGWSSMRMNDQSRVWLGVSDLTWN